MAVGDVLSAPQSGWTRADGASDSITKTGAWTAVSNSGLYSGAANLTSTQGNSFSFSFYGTAFRLIDQFDVNRTKNTTITLDGASEVVSFYSNPASSFQTVVYEKLNLPLGTHKVTVTKNDATSTSLYLIIDAVDVIGEFSIVGQALTSPESGWTRIQDTAPQFIYTNSASQADSSAGGGNYHALLDTTAKMSFKFQGTKIRLIGYQASNYSDAMAVKIDGVVYSFSQAGVGQYQTLNFEKTGLALGLHDVEIYNTKNMPGLIDAIDIDGYVVTTLGSSLPSPEYGWRRYDDSTCITYVGTGWSSVTGDANLFQGTGHVTTLSGTTSNSIQFIFSGTKIRLIDLYWTNRVNNVTVTIDGIPYTYNPSNSVNKYQVLVFEKTGLAQGMHTVSITTTSTTGNFSIDAIDVDDTGYLVAQVGQQLTSPEVGWRRYDDNAIAYSADWSHVSDGSNYNSTYSYTTTVGGKASFKFLGSKLRIVVPKSGNASVNVTVKIDGVSESFNGNGTGFQILAYEKLGLSYGVHTVEIISNNAYTYLDAIDIDATGILFAQIGQSLTAPEDGWRRVEDTHPNIRYDSNNPYGNIHYNAGAIRFKFYGTKIRLIYDYNISDVLTIDGVTYPISSMNNVPSGLAAEVLGLPLGVHDVVITTYVGSSWFSQFNAVDLDATGYIVTQIGEPFPAPDLGWVRIDETDSRLKFHSSFISYSTGTNNSIFYNNSEKYTKTNGATVTFKFYGSKFRLISNRLNGGADIGGLVKVNIDGVDVGTYSQKGALEYVRLVYESTELGVGFHDVTLTAILNAGEQMMFDALDVAIAHSPISTVKVNNTLFNFGNVYYVDPVKGEDVIGSGVSKDIPLKSVNIAISQASSGDAIYLMAGKHNVTYVAGSVGYGGLCDQGKTLSFFGDAGKTLCLSDGVYTNTARDHHAISTYGVGTKMYDLTFIHQTNGRANNYSVAIFGREATFVNAEVNNCAFVSDATAPSMFYDSSVTSNVQMNNCSFFVRANWVASYAGAAKYGKNNCITNYTFVTEGGQDGFNATRVALSGTSFKADPASPWWVNAGGSTNPDGTNAHIGVYGGKLAWTGLTDRDFEPQTTGVKRTDVKDMEEGDYIACNYNTIAIGNAGLVSNFGVETHVHIPYHGFPVISGGGTFFFVKVAPGILVADRNLSNTVLWLNLSAYKAIEGVPIATSKLKSGIIPYQKTFLSSPISNSQGFLAMGTSDTWQGSNLIVARDEYAVIATGTVEVEYDALLTGFYSTALNHLFYLVTPDPVGKYTTRDSNYGVYQFADAPIRGQYTTAQPTQLVWHRIKHVINFTAKTMTTYVDGVVNNFTSNVVSPTIADGAKLYIQVGVGSYTYAYENIYKNFTIKNNADSKANPISFCEDDYGEGILRVPFGGIVYADKYGNATLTQESVGMGGVFPVDNEWDAFITQFNFIKEGKTLDDVFNIAQSFSFCQETPMLGNWKEMKTGATYTTASNLVRIVRGFPDRDVNANIAYTLTDVTTTGCGYRPIVEYREG